MEITPGIRPAWIWAGGRILRYIRQIVEKQCPKNEMWSPFLGNHARHEMEITPGMDLDFTPGMDL